jgi:hypothetical protein
MVDISGNRDDEVLGVIVGIVEIFDVLFSDRSNIFSDSVNWLSQEMISERLFFNLKYYKMLIKK